MIFLYIANISEFHGITQEIFFQLSQVNLNNMLCPAVSDPFYGRHYRLVAMCHQVLALPLVAKFIVYASLKLGLTRYTGEKEVPVFVSQQYYRRKVTKDLGSAGDGGRQDDKSGKNQEQDNSINVNVKNADVLCDDVKNICRDKHVEGSTATSIRERVTVPDSTVDNSGSLQYDDNTIREGVGEGRTIVGSGKGVDTVIHRNGFNNHVAETLDSGKSTNMVSQSNGHGKML